MSHSLQQSETLAPDDGLPEGFEYRRNRSVDQKNKHKRQRSIRQGIDAYYQHRNHTDDYDDDFEDDNWYH